MESGMPRVSLGPFDAKYEFDAPQFRDFNEITPPEGSPDAWFDNRKDSLPSDDDFDDLRGKESFERQISLTEILMVDGKDVGGEEGGFDSENENKENVSPVAYSQPLRVAGETEGRAVLASIAHLEAGDDAEFVELELENDDESLHEQKIDEGYKAPDTVIKLFGQLSLTTPKSGQNSSNLASTLSSPLTSLSPDAIAALEAKTPSPTMAGVTQSTQDQAMTPLSQLDNLIASTKNKDPLSTSLNKTKALSKVMVVEVVASPPSSEEKPQQQLAAAKEPGSFSTARGALVAQKVGVELGDARQVQEAQATVDPAARRNISSWNELMNAPSSDDEEAASASRVNAEATCKQKRRLAKLPPKPCEKKIVGNTNRKPSRSTFGRGRVASTVSAAHTGRSRATATAGVSKPSYTSKSACRARRAAANAVSGPAAAPKDLTKPSNSTSRKRTASKFEPFKSSIPRNTKAAKTAKANGRAARAPVPNSSRSKKRRAVTPTHEREAREIAKAKAKAKELRAKNARRVRAMLESDGDEYRPVRSTKDLTEPMPFQLSTSKRTRTKSRLNLPPDQDADGLGEQHADLNSASGEQDFVPLAAFASNNSWLRSGDANLRTSVASSAGLDKERGLTTPKAFKFATDKRRQSYVSASASRRAPVMSTEERQLLEMRQHKFTARPAPNSSVKATPKRTATKAPTKPLTKFSEFKLSETPKRARRRRSSVTSWNELSPEPSKVGDAVRKTPKSSRVVRSARSIRPGTAATSSRKTSKATVPASTTSFKARPVPSSTYKSPASARKRAASAAARANAAARPFALHSAKRSQQRNTTTKQKAPLDRKPSALGSSSRSNQRKPSGTRIQALVSTTKSPSASLDPAASLLEVLKPSVLAGKDENAPPVPSAELAAGEIDCKRNSLELLRHRWRRTASPESADDKEFAVFRRLQM